MLSTSGVLASSFMGWPSIFYLSGSLSGLWAILWLFFGSNSPADYKYITAEERDFIQSSLGHNETDAERDEKKNRKTPWAQIFTSMPFISLAIVHCAHNWGFWTLLTEMPSYMKGVLKYDIKKVNALDKIGSSRCDNITMLMPCFHLYHLLIVRHSFSWIRRAIVVIAVVVAAVQNALLSALPYLAMLLLSYFFSFLSGILERKNCVPLKYSRKVFNTIGTQKGQILSKNNKCKYELRFSSVLFSFLGHWIPMCALIALGYVTSADKDLAIFLLVIAVGINSSTYLGFQVCKHLQFDIGRAFLHPRPPDSLRLIQNFPSMIPFHQNNHVSFTLCVSVCV